MVFWSLISAGAIALFWTIWYFVTGSVPVVKKIQFANNLTLNLPFGISRWWDVLIGPIWSISIVAWWTKIKDHKDVIDILFIELIAGGFFGLFFGLIHGLDFGMTVGMAVVIAMGLIFLSFFEIIYGLIAGLITGLAYLLAYGLIAGLIAGLATVVILGFVIVISYGLAYGVILGMTHGPIAWLTKYLK